jgi:hypothetical protein
MSKRSPKHRPFRRDGGDAFLPDPSRLEVSASGTFIAALDAESVAEEFIASVTSAGFVLEDARNELSIDEIGGPFLEDEDDDLELDA